MRLNPDDSSRARVPGVGFLEDPHNVRPVAFVAGAYGRSTVYIMSSNESQELVKPLVVALLN
jgi:hypothetical protein